jgi:hypothetical protein
MSAASIAQHPADAPIVTTQLTSKAFKRQQLWAALLIIVSLVGIMAAQATDARERSVGWAALWILGLLGGLIWFLVVRIRTWWHHG